MLCSDFWIETSFLAITINGTYIPVLFGKSPEAFNKQDTIFVCKALLEKLVYVTLV